MINDPMNIMFTIATIAGFTAITNTVLKGIGREEQANIVTMVAVLIGTGFIATLMFDLFETAKTFVRFY